MNLSSVSDSIDKKKNLKTSLCNQIENNKVKKEKEKFASLKLEKAMEKETLKR